MPRQTLENSRNHEIIKFVFRGRDYLVGFGRFPDGRIAEVFIDSVKGGADAIADARDAAVCFSIAAQYGAPMSVVREALTRNENNVATGILGAALDAIAEAEQSK